MVKNTERVGAGLSTQCAGQQVATSFCKVSDASYWFRVAYMFDSVLLTNFYVQILWVNFVIFA